MRDTRSFSHQFLPMHRPVSGHSAVHVGAVGSVRFRSGEISHATDGTNEAADDAGSQPLPPPPGPTNDDRTPVRSGKTTRIFIVEDEALIAMELEALLQDLGYEVCGKAARAEIALQRIPASRPDLALVDINLGSDAMNGLELAERLSESSEMPIVFVTAYSDAQLVEHAAAVGSFGYLVKPFDERELRATIEVAIARSSAATAIRESERRVRKLNSDLDRRVAERTTDLQQAIAELEAFSYAIAHDLRAPLRALSGYASILMRDNHAAPGSRAAHMLQRIEANTQRMAALIDGLLEFSRLSRAPVHSNPVDMKELFAREWKERSAEMDQTRIQVRITELPDARGDKELLQVVVANLLSNALKFSAARDPAVIEIGFNPDAGAYFVRDNGVGFDMTYSSKLFLPFQRLHQDHEFEGTGIGLATVKRIVQRHGGRVWVDARTGEGASFFFTLNASPRPKA